LIIQLPPTVRASKDDRCEKKKSPSTVYWSGLGCVYRVSGLGREVN
jgi:hypothetical protein